MGNAQKLSVQILENVVFVRLQLFVISVTKIMIYRVIKKNALVISLFQTNYKRSKKGCKDTIGHCEVCENQSVCKKCVNEYFLIGNECESNFPFVF